jgi:toxin ParE1/3/4
MMTRILYRPLARDDINNIAQYLQERNSSAAQRFVDATESAIAKLADHPGLGTLRRTRAQQLAGLRSWPIRRFRNYIIFYMPSADGIEVLRILHGARRIAPLLRQG